MKNIKLTHYTEVFEQARKYYTSCKNHQVNYWQKNNYFFKEQYQNLWYLTKKHWWIFLISLVIVIVLGIGWCLTQSIFTPIATWIHRLVNQRRWINFMNCLKFLSGDKKMFLQLVDENNIEFDKTLKYISIGDYITFFNRLHIARSNHFQKYY